MTDGVAAALAWFWDRPAPGLSADDITHGIVLAREVRRLTALVEAQEQRTVALCAVIREILAGRRVYDNDDSGIEVSEELYDRARAAEKGGAK